VGIVVEKEVAFETHIFAPHCGSDCGGSTASARRTCHSAGLVASSLILRLVLEPSVGMGIVVLESSVGLVPALLVA
jgi:hypothetical protein